MINKSLSFPVVFLASFCLLQDAHSDEAAKLNRRGADHEGYSYIQIGAEQFQYSEKILAVTSTAKVNNPIFMTGGLVNVNDKLDFSINAATTLSASTSTEKWNVNDGQSQAFINGNATSANNPIQTNKFTMSRSSTEVLAHYKIDRRWRALIGVDYSTTTFKRYNFVSNFLNVQSGVNEESTLLLNLNAGVQYQSSSNLSSKFRYYASSTALLPIFRKTTNSLGVDVKSTKGWGIGANAGVSYSVYNKVHIGAYLGYDFRMLDQSEHRNNYVVPKNTTSHYTSGLTLIYDL